jgi:IclR family acetate operon transcriptional repressor
MALVGPKQLARLLASDLRQPILNAFAERTRELVRLTAVQNNTLVDRLRPRSPLRPGV